MTSTCFKIFWRNNLKPQYKETSYMSFKFNLEWLVLISIMLKSSGILMNARKLHLYIHNAKFFKAHAHKYLKKPYMPYTNLASRTITNTQTFTLTATQQKITRWIYNTYGAGGTICRWEMILSVNTHHTVVTPCVFFCQVEISVNVCMSVTVCIAPR